MGTLYLVGAGPGDPELITLKAVNLLKKADVVLYDALVNPILLDYAQDAKIIEYVGKRRGEHSKTQNEINERIVQLSSCFETVVRLKGGDPFVFGRGWEEVEIATKFGIDTKVIPGISSAMSVPAICDIPVTSRGVSRSFHVMSATTKNRELNKEIYESVHYPGTRVILMGLHKIKEIVTCYKVAGLSKMPIAIIQDGSLPTQKEVNGTVENIIQKLSETLLKAPALIVIGEVVSLKEIKNGAKKLSLSSLS